ncbi:MAG: stage III sporulation protein AC [Clostridium sp.]|uniref:stage III sporulation protein AC n=1 Tax=Clostridium sp. TaxID=1506 RepID=UPI003F3F005C
MLDVSLLFKLGGIGILMVVLDKVLKSSGKDDVAMITNLIGIVIMLIMAASMIGELFQTVKTTFML